QKRKSYNNIFFLLLLFCIVFFLGYNSVDGHWGSWSAWSSCDVTCENGTQTRSRTCSDPAPAHGGIDCIGSNITTKSCSRKLCPVHGGWTIWSSWDACSVACGVGLEKRHRNCSNPIPDRNGLQCFGDTLDVRICLPGPCANGGWTNWGQWSTCSVTCRDGLKSRSRTFTNPRPSPLGKYCDGDPSEVVSCTKSSCITKSTPTTSTTTTTLLPTVPRSCFLCQGPPQICEHVNFPADCPLEKQYCINTLTNFRNASRLVEMKCGTRDDCQKGWFERYSSDDKCTAFDQAFIYTNRFDCEFCCASDNCNQFVNPSNKWHP
ncbi:thrombospondin-2-like, partial [Ruditapes philippinarum]|uniref:thrombospondin-2-like n=1 Tax=Ruditapes philippinarum TaxID=129788 RepID=UPI00295B66A3